MGVESKTITKLLGRFMGRGLKLWQNKEITTTLTAPGTIRTAVGRFIYLGFYVAFNTVQVISRRVVGRAEETST